MNYELLVEPRSLFAADGQMLHCSTKSNLVIAILEGIKVKKVEEEGRNLRIEPGLKVCRYAPILRTGTSEKRLRQYRHFCQG